MASTLKQKTVSAVRDFLAATPARTPDEISAANAGPLVVAGLFRTASGIGQSARICADALEARGRKVVRCDLSDAFNQVDFEKSHNLHPFPKDRAGTVILHLNPLETPKGLTVLGLIGRRRWRVVGYWVWEFEAIPSEWKAGQRYVSEIWTPSSFSARSIGQSVNLGVKIAPHAVRPPSEIAPDALLRDIPENNLIVLSMADTRSSLDRKNIAGAIETFLRGVGEQDNCWMVIKTRNFETDTPAAQALLGRYAKHPRIRLINQSCSERQKWSLLSRCDVFLSLHRSEGFGLVIAEAMSLGKCVIATGWSGNVDFMSDDTASLTPYRLIRMNDQANVYQSAEGLRWADPDIEYAATTLRRLSRNQEERLTMGDRAKTFIQANLTGLPYEEALRSAPIDA